MPFSCPKTGPLSIPPSQMAAQAPENTTPSLAGSQMVRVRFAPSPTGELHVGGLRTALFNALFARHHEGRFILRIEDTDRKRQVPGAEANLIALLNWSGLRPDEGPEQGGDRGPYRQSERLPRYRAAAERLIAEGHAYRCYCTAAELEAMRAAQIARGLPPKYDGRHRHLSPAEETRLQAAGRPYVIRMRIPAASKPIVIADRVRGKVAFALDQLDDQVLLKSDGFPTYHLAVVVDDHAMGITHVLRAEEWLPSTPKHVLLAGWLGYPLPGYAHLPLLLNPDGSKMSKRAGDTSTEAYRRAGYLPEALINFLALMGWNPGDAREVFAPRELEQLFTLERVGRSGAVFNQRKLDWMNAQHLQRMTQDELLTAVRPFLRGAASREPEDRLRQMLAAVASSLTRLEQINAALAPFYAAVDEDIVRALQEDPEAQRALRAFAEEVEAIHAAAIHAAAIHTADWEASTFRVLARAAQKRCGLKGRALFQPLRRALTGADQGPDLAAMAAVLGIEEVHARLRRVLTATEEVSA